MGKQGGGKQKGQDQGGQKQQGGPPRGENGHEEEPVIRLVAVHGSRVAVAVGTSFRVLDCSTGTELCSNDTEHQKPIRVLAFSDDAALLLTAADDKQVKLWDTATWKCTKSLPSGKKASAGALTHNGRHVIFADKFGDVMVATTAPAADQQQQPPPAPLLGHLQAIVTCVAVLPGDTRVVTTDRDAKVRVSILPADPLQGSYEIQAYCMGHREFVSCAVPVPAAGDAGDALLLTGGGDSTVKLWDPETGKQLGSYTAVSEEVIAAATAAQAAAAGDAAGEDEGEEEQGEGDGEAAGGDNGPSGPRRIERRALVPVVSVALAPSGALAAVVVEGQREVQLIKVDAAARSLGPCVQRLAVPDDVLAPCRAAFDPTGRLWLVGGPPMQMTQSAHVAVAAPAADGAYAFATADVLPAAARAFLERRVEDEEAVAAEAAAAGLSYTMQLRKRIYDEREVTRRKTVRSDKAESDRLARMRQRETEAAAV